MANIAPPLPEPSLDDKPHWEAMRRHEFLIQKCGKCGTVQHPPRPACFSCHGIDMGWVKASGRGTIYSYTIVPQATHPAWRESVPYNVVIVELEEDVRVISNLVGTPNDQIKVGLPVVMVFDDVTEDFTLPRFKLAQR